MKSPLRTQIFWPVAGLLTLSVLLFTAISTWYAAGNSDLQTRRHMRAVTDALGNASYPLTRDVVHRIGAMIGGDVVVLDRHGNLTASTTGPSETLLAALHELPVDDSGASSSHTVHWKSRVHLVSAIHRTHVPQPGTLFVMFPQDDLANLWRDSLLPTLAVAVPVLMLALALTLVISRRIAGRVDQVRDLFQHLASGDFQPVIVSGRDDEIRDLMMSANDLSQQLRTMQEQMIVSERLQLLGQLSGGLAHQLRNSITGARLAIQLHQRHCSSSDDEMIRTAVSQLNLTEEQVLAVISLRPDADTSEPVDDCDLCELIQDVTDLLHPLCDHWKSTLSTKMPDCLPVQLRSRRSVKGALLNLIQNAVESAGIGGQVTVAASSHDQQVMIQVLDSGPGFPQQDRPLIGAFQTTKTDGIGLGLTIAQHAVDQESGELTIGRCDGQTCVTLQLPLRIRIPSPTSQE